MASAAQTRPRASAWRVSLGALVSLGLGAGFGFGSGCYAEREPPPTYRYQCGGDGDCEEGEECRDGICERMCTQATFEDDCDTSTHVMCFNGACSNTCEVGANVCPSVQECVDLSELGIDIGGGSSNPFGGGSSATLGICGRKCSEGDDLCPDGEMCLPDLTIPGADGEELTVGGFCVATCDPANPDPEQCGAGFVCMAPFGFCVPDSFDMSSDSGMPEGTGGATMTAGDMGDMGDMSGGEMTGGEMTGGEMTGGTTG